MANRPIPLGLGCWEALPLNLLCPPQTGIMIEGKDWALGSEAGCCLAAAILASIPVISAVSGLLWKFPLPGEGVRAPLRGDKEIKKEEGKMLMTEGKTTLPVETPPQSVISLARADHTL